MVRVADDQHLPEETEIKGIITAIRESKDPIRNQRRKRLLDKYKNNNLIILNGLTVGGI